MCCDWSVIFPNASLLLPNLTVIDNIQTAHRGREGERNGGRKGQKWRQKYRRERQKIVLLGLEDLVVRRGEETEREE